MRELSERCCQQWVSRQGALDCSDRSAKPSRLRQGWAAPCRPQRMRSQAVGQVAQAIAALQVALTGWKMAIRASRAGHRMERALRCWVSRPRFQAIGIQLEVLTQKLRFRSLHRLGQEARQRGSQSWGLHLMLMVTKALRIGEWMWLPDSRLRLPQWTAR